jgi:ABC-type lipoprotein release transport system permease subunit
METNSIGTIVGALGVLLAYGLSFWRIFNRFRGDKFIESATITTFLLAGAFSVHKIPDAPSWMAKAIFVLACCFCWLSVYFGLQQAYHAIRHRKAKHTQAH